MPDASRRPDQRLEYLQLEPGVDLEQIVPGRFLLLDRLDGRLGRGDAVAVQRRTGRVDRGAQDVVPRRPRAQLEVAGMAQHPADGGDPAGDVEEEHPIDDAVGRLPARDVRVHLGQAGDQVLAPTLDPRGPGRHRDAIGRPDGGDPVAADEDGLMRDRALPVHGNEGDVDEGGDALLRERRHTGEAQERAAGGAAETGHGRLRNGVGKVRRRTRPAEAAFQAGLNSGRPRPGSPARTPS